MAKKDYAQIAYDYCIAVIADNLPNRKTCKLERLACQRHLTDLKKQDDPKYPYYFSESAAYRRCSFTEHLQHTKDRWRGTFIVLEDHQVFMQAVGFGWLKKKNDKRRFTKMYFELPRKNGKALEINTPVFTTFGWKKHGNLKAGDCVFNPNGKPVKVLAVTEQYNGPCYEIGFSDGEKIIAHANHEWITDRTWYTKRKKGERNQGELPPVESWEIAKTLRVESVRPDFVHRVKMNFALELPKITLPIDPYTLGAWLGDGTTSAPQITSMDDEIINKIRSAGYSVRHINHNCNQGKAKTYSLTNIGDVSEFSKNLRKMKLIGNKHIPGLYFMSSIEQRYELLRGLLDTDGFISKAGQISLTLTNKRLIKDVKILMRSLGLKTCLKEGIAKLYGKDCGPKYLLHCFPNDDTPLFNLTRKLERQQNVNVLKKRRSSKTIISADFVGDYTVNCITVEGGLYLAGSAFTMTHNSIEAATDGLFLAFADGIQAAEVYAGATTEAQAMMVFQPAWQMVNMNPEFAEYFSVEITGTSKNPTSAFRPLDSSRFMPIVGKPGDGSSPNGALVDEYHEHSTSVLYDAMDTGMGSREQPVLKVITTAGTNTSYPCYDLHCEAVKVLEGSLVDDSLFCIIFTIDEGDSWEDFEVWKKCNPNYLISIEEDYLLNKYRDALNKPQQRNIILTKHLNIWQNAGISFVDLLKWKMGEDPALTLNMFVGQECWLALDLASKIDLCALVILFKYKRNIINTNCPKCYGEVEIVNGMNVCVSGLALENGNICDWKKPVLRNCVAGFAKHYLPEDTIERRENQHYQKWASEGYLTKTEGARTDFSIVEEDIRQLSKNHIVKELAFDQKEATHIIHLISKWANFECVEFPQSVALINEPMQELEAMINANEFWHNDDPVYTWCMGNVVKKKARFGGTTKTYFPTKENDKLKIDSGVATIMAIGRLMVSDNDGDDYNARAARGETEILRVL